MFIWVVLLPPVLAAEDPAGPHLAVVDDQSGDRNRNEVLERTAMEPDDEGSTQNESKPHDYLSVSGNFGQKYRFRRTGAGEDQDVYGYINLDATCIPKESEVKPPFGGLNFNLQGSYSLDIDSFETAGDASRGVNFLPFTDLTNTFGDRFRGFIHSAYGEAEEVAFLERLRLGRQQVYREEGILFDGAYARTKQWKTFSFDVYGGVPAHLYERSSSGDAFAGIGVETRPFRGLSLGADYFYIRDENDDTSDEEDHLYLMRARYDVDREWTVSGSASWVDTRDRRQVLDIRYLSENWGLLASLRAVRQNAIVGFQTSELSPYLFIMGDYAPHYQYQVDLYQPVGENFGVGGGLNIRHLENRSDEGLYNHEFQNYYLSFEANDLWAGGRASIRGDLWDSDADDIHSVGFELEQKAAEFLRIRVGTSYSLYRIDFFSGTERERDRIYYAKLRWQLAPKLNLDTDYQYERDSITEYHTVTTGLRVWF